MSPLYSEADWARWVRRRAAGFLLAVVVSVPPTVAAEFYSWTDAQGHVRVSNVPPPGVLSDGSIAAAFRPLSIAGQQAALRVRLQRRDEELARDAAAQSAAPAAPAADTATPAARVK